jgi:hypothetical protein
VMANACGWAFNNRSSRVRPWQRLLTGTPE